MSFIKEIRKRIFPSIIALSALSVSASAAFYSVSGLSKLFAGASFEVILMASSLEVAKLVIASLLYQYWGKLNKLLRIYLSIAAVVLVVITSAGIYGFLSAAYQETAASAGVIDKQIELIELKKTRFDENRTYYLEEKKKLDESITTLRDGLSNNKVQYRDSETGQIITTTSSTQRKSLEKQLESAITTRDEVSKKIETVTDSISSLEIKILDVENNSEVASELGPLKYISELTNTPMSEVVNILMLIIIFVFDPLAICLVIAANFAFGQISKRNDESYPENQVEPDNKDMEDDWYDGLPNDVVDEILKGNVFEVDENDDIENISTQAGKIEKEMVKDEPEPLKPTDELIERLEKELEKLTGNKIKEEKRNQLTDDLLKKIDKLSDMIDLDIDDNQEENQKENTENKEEEKPIVNPLNKKVLTYRRRDGGSNTRFDRF